MKEVLINQCDYCKRTSFYKSSIRKHEQICFHNPGTRSCATCLWFSPKHNIWPLDCFRNALKIKGASSRIHLETMCDKWADSYLMVDIEIMDNEYCDIMKLLLAGDEDLPFLSAYSKYENFLQKGMRFELRLAGGMNTLSHLIISATLRNRFSC